MPRCGGGGVEGGWRGGGEGCRGKTDVTADSKHWVTTCRKAMLGVRYDS